jgi:hypothetical protein
MRLLMCTLHAEVAPDEDDTDKDKEDDNGDSQYTLIEYIKTHYSNANVAWLDSAQVCGNLMTDTEVQYQESLMASVQSIKDE